MTTTALAAAAATTTATKTGEFSARSVSSQFRVLEAALEELDAAEKDRRRAQGCVWQTPTTPTTTTTMTTTQEEEDDEVEEACIGG